MPGREFTRVRAWLHAADFRSLERRLRARLGGKRAVGFDVFNTVLRRRVDPEQVKDCVARRLADMLAAAGQPADWRVVRARRTALEVELGRAAEARGDDHEFRLGELLPRWVAECTSAVLDAGDAGRESEGGGTGGEGRRTRRSDATAPSDATATGADIAAWARELHAHELKLEALATCPTPGIRDVLARLAERSHAHRRSRTGGLRLIFVTDNYLDLADVHELLRRHGLAEFFAAGYCSSTLLRTKRTGRLFEVVVAAEGLRPDELLFVGDNVYSDVAAPRRLGIDALWLRDPPELKRRTRLNVLRTLAVRDERWLGALARETIAQLPGHIRPQAAPERQRAPEYGLGLLLAPAFIGFTQHVM
ncbi:MAG: HAD family hydrolase, partial [Planctomycetota bacterium]